MGKKEEIEEAIIGLQTVLVDLGIPVIIDGKFGGRLKKAVELFQTTYVPTNITHKDYIIGKIDGEVGRNTVLGLDESAVEGWVYERILQSDLFKESNSLELFFHTKIQSYATSCGKTDRDDIDAVILLQQALMTMRFTLTDADGEFTTETELAVRNFQEAYLPTHNIHSDYAIDATDGILDVNTLLAIDEALVEEWKYPRQFEITDIPTVMRDKLNWPKSAELMDLWFSLPARTMTAEEKSGDDPYPEDYTNENMFPWSWLTDFDQVETALTELNQIKRLMSPAALFALKRNFRKKINQLDIVDKHLLFNDTADIIELHDLWQFQYIEVGYELLNVDDLYGSLGNFSIYAAVTKATITSTEDSNVFHVVVEEIGLYMKDTFDFIGDQYLGHWDFDGMGLNPVAGASTPFIEWVNRQQSIHQFRFEWKLPAWNPTLGVMESFGNQEFREYRTAIGKGGDVLLLSDIKHQTVHLELTVDIRKNYDN